MTLIAATTNFGYPIIIGDILGTSENIDNELAIPMFLKGVNDLLPEGRRFLPAKLRQKIYIINGLLSIALAGLEYEMKFFLVEIKNYFHYRETTLNNLETFLKDFDYSETISSSAIILLAEKNTDSTLIHYRFFGKVQVEQVPYYETVIVCGSGTEDFLTEANADIRFPEEQNPIYDALAKNYLLLSRILLTERLYLETIANHWGAGFEIIYFNGNEFIKMDDITYIFWNAKLNLENGEYNASPNIILNFKYHEEILAITATDGKKTEGYGVIPITMSKEDVDMSKMPTKPHINGKRICSIFFIELSNGRTISPAFYTEKADNPGEIFFDSGIPEELSDLFPDGKTYDLGLIAVWFNKGHLSVIINRELQDTMMERIRQNALSISE